MLYLIAGLVVFLGIHSTRIFADPWRTRQIERFGVNGWKGIYSLISLAGFVLLVWGYGESRTSPVDLYNPPMWTRHLAALLTLPAFVLVVAAYVPGNHFKARLGHPMYMGVKIWALAHLLSNGRLADVLLFGGFLAWAVMGFVVSRKRDRAASVVYAPGQVLRTVIVVVVGLVAWAVFAMWAHGVLIGVRPFG
jgi:uncharacterized membrane protein